MTVVSTDFAFWSRAVLSALWSEGRGLTVDELANDLNVPVETMEPVIEALVARHMLSLDATDTVSDMEPAAHGLRLARVRLASAGSRF